MNLTMDIVDGGDVQVDVVLSEESKISRSRLVVKLYSFLIGRNPLKSLDMSEFGGTNLKGDVENVMVCLENLDNLGESNLKYSIFREEFEVEDISDTK